MGIETCLIHPDCQDISPRDIFVTFADINLEVLYLGRYLISTRNRTSLGGQPTATLPEDILRPIIED